MSLSKVVISWPHMMILILVKVIVILLVENLGTEVTICEQKEKSSQKYLKFFPGSIKFSNLDQILTYGRCRCCGSGSSCSSGL